MKRVEVRYPRGLNAVLAVIFGTALVIVVSGGFGGPGPRIDRPMPFWLVVFILAGVALPALKTAVVPSLIVAWDSQGIELGRGIFLNRVTRIPWSQVTAVKEGKIELPSSDDRPEHRIQYGPALRIEFDSSASVPSTGYTVSMPDPPRAWVVSAKMLPASLQRMIETVERALESGRG